MKLNDLIYFDNCQDWKALVESVQIDRTRIQEASIELEAKLEEANIEIARLQEQLAGRGGGSTWSFGSPAVKSCSSPVDEDGTPRTVSR